MEKQKIVLILLIVSILLSGISLVVSIGGPDTSDYQPVDNCAERVNCVLGDDATSTGSGTVGFEIAGGTG